MKIRFSECRDLSYMRDLNSRPRLGFSLAEALKRMQERKRKAAAQQRARELSIEEGAQSLTLKTFGRHE